jgi:uncharacterized circularly permuted ATP-grasp superfamily protein
MRIARPRCVRGGLFFLHSWAARFLIYARVMEAAPPFQRDVHRRARVRPHYAAFAEWLAQTPPARIAQNRHAAELLFHRVGITFAVYGEASGTERLIPFDIVPHVIPGEGWDKARARLRQRVQR